MSVAYQRFPCCNESRGCLEYLIPREVSSHEQICPYKVIKCPTRFSCSCVWEGPCSDILDHFKTDHPINLLSKNVFEVDIVSDHTDYFLYVCNDDLFSLQKSSQNNEFSLKLDYLMKLDDFNKMAYEIKLLTANREKEICATQDIGKSYNITIKEIKNRLNNPTIIVAEMKILKNGTTNGSTIQKSNDNQSQLNMLECPVCLEYLIPPIYQCKIGHSICASCKSELSECPSCKSEFVDTRNFLVENMMSLIKYSCKYDECPYQGEPTSIKAHQETCIFGPFKCPLNEYQSCTEVFSFKDLYHHVMDKHYEYLLEMDTISIPFDIEMEENINDCFIIPYGSRLFKFCCLYQYNEKTFKYSVHLIGNPEDNLTYKYDIDFRNSNTNNRLYIKRNCDITNSQPFQYDGTIVLNYDQLSEFINHQLCFRTRISVQHSK